MNYTVRRDGDEYNARDANGRLIGNVFFLKEHEGGSWKWSVIGTADFGFCDEKGTALLSLSKALDARFAKADLVAA
jgi:hypothetical protein